MWRKLFSCLLVINCKECKAINANATSGFGWSVSVELVSCQFDECHDDPSLDPEEDDVEEVVFTWLGILQYIHVKSGTPHYFRVPRVVLITRQFVLSTAVDAAEIPEGYALGNIIFGDYERDHEECRLTLQAIAAGAECPPATLIMPIADVLLHPEYKHFGAKNSLAILKMIKPIKSEFNIPACLPLKNYAIRKDRRQTNEKFYHIDWSSDVPRHFVDETKEVQKLSLLPRELCALYDEHNQNATRFVKNRMACTTGCGLHSGAPSMTHESTGQWTIVALATGSAPCPDVMRPKRPPAPPHHILVYPYVPWITAAIAGTAVGAFAKDDPFGFALTARRQNLGPNPHDVLWHGWIGHWYYGGPRCYDRGDKAEDLFRFYHEIFQLKPEATTYMFYYIEIDGASGTNVICVKVGMPYRLGRVVVGNLNTPVAHVKIYDIKFWRMYRFQVEAYGYNSTSESESFSEETEESETPPSGYDSEEEYY